MTVFDTTTRAADVVDQAQREGAAIKLADMLIELQRKAFSLADTASDIEGETATPTGMEFFLAAGETAIGFQPRIWRKVGTEPAHAAKRQGGGHWWERVPIEEPLDIDTNTLTMSNDHDGRRLRFTHASGCVVTIPENSILPGFGCTLIQETANDVTFSGAGSFVLRSRGGTKLGGQYAVAGLFTQLLNAGYLAGDTRT